MKKKVVTIIILCALFGMAGCGVGQTEYDKLKEENSSLNNTVEKLRNDYDSLSEEYDKLKENYDTLNAAKTELETQAQQYQAMIQQYSAYLQQAGISMDTYSQQYNQAQMEEIAKTYETGVTYENLRDESDTYLGEKAMFSGTVINGNTDNNVLTIAFAVDNDTSKIILMQGDVAWVTNGLTVGMQVKVYGTSAGLYDYTDEDGNTTKVPGMSLEYVVQE